LGGTCQAPFATNLGEFQGKKGDSKLENSLDLPLLYRTASVIKIWAFFRGGNGSYTPLSFEGEGDTRGEVDKQPLPLTKGKGVQGIKGIGLRGALAPLPL